jgi:hypothetical protein
MKSTLQPYLRSDDMGRLSVALQQLAEHQPPGYQGWSDSARLGIRAADQHDVDAVRAQCKSCHDAHREHYRHDRREMKLF